VAHADTPGYRRRDVERPGGFDGQLRDAGLRLERTDPRHLGTGGAGAAGDYRLVTGPRGQRPDGNGVDLESEVVKLRRNAGAFEDQATILSRLLALRRMAATADAR
jgi:flagellar basal body rod protein FlgB